MLKSTEYKVLIPTRILDQKHNKQVFIQEVKEYMKRYPHYRPISVKDGFVICERRV